MQELQILYQDIPDRWITGDRVIRRVLRQWLRPPRTYLSGMSRVVRNFLSGLERQNVAYRLNPSRFRLKRDQPVISFGMGRLGLDGVHSETPLIAAIGFPYPAEFPELSEQYNLRLFLQHSRWALDFVKSAGIYDTRVFHLWHAGIDTDYWHPATFPDRKESNILLYDKIHWDRDYQEINLTRPIIEYLEGLGYTIRLIRYGAYTPAEYKSALQTVRAAVFLSPHESQGFAYQECLSCNVPVFAWDQGIWLDPMRLVYGVSDVPATSVPFFDQRCGATFKNFSEFEFAWKQFESRLEQRLFRPREFVMEKLTIANSTSRMLELLTSVAQT